MGKHSKRNKKAQEFVPPHFPHNKEMNEPEEEASVFSILLSALFATGMIIFENLYPTNEFRKRKQQHYFQEQLTSDDVDGIDHAYSLLGISPGECSLSEVKKAYRKLALKYHPDRQTKMTIEEKKIAEAKMKDINK